MIRIIREGSEKYPIILKTIIVVIAVTFIGGMGWYGYEAARPSSVATIGSYSVSLDEYRRAKQRLYRFYKRHNFRMKRSTTNSSNRWCLMAFWKGRPGACWPISWIFPSPLRTYITRLFPKKNFIAMGNLILNIINGCSKPTG